jgi:putative transcriptional regulator
MSRGAGRDRGAARGPERDVATPDVTTAGLAPGFLVAAPGLRDPNFARSVVLMAEHTPEGALGFVVNRASRVTVAEVLEQVDPALRAAAERSGAAAAPVLVGGPVQPERLWILHRPGAVPAEDGGIVLERAVAVGGSRELLEALVRAPAPGPFLLLLGYAGWGPFQVEREVAAGGWIPLPFEERLVLEVPVAERWDEAVRRLGLTPGGFSVGGGGAQA